jgi:hypothetical protein
MAKVLLMQHRSLGVLSVLSVLVFASLSDGQARPRQQQPQQQPQRATLSATITLSAARVRSSDDLRVTVQLRNSSAQQVVIPSQMLETAILLLEVRNAQGERMNTIPPAVPRNETVTLAPGAVRSVQLRLNVFSPQLPPGSYTVRPRGAVIEGQPVSFVVVR